jgi:hypothetical protein
MNRLPNITSRSTWADFQIPYSARSIMVGPYRVNVSNKQHYRLYSVDVGDVTVLKQASVPAIHNIVDAISLAIKGKVEGIDMVKFDINRAKQMREKGLKLVAEKREALYALNAEQKRLLIKPTYPTNK